MESNKKFIEEFEEEVFWDKLTNNLVQRDLLEEKAIEEFKKMSGIEVLNQEDKFIEKYDSEFIKNGIKNIRIINLQITTIFLAHRG